MTINIKQDILRQIQVILLRYHVKTIPFYRGNFMLFFSQHSREKRHFPIKGNIPLILIYFMCVLLYTLA